MGIPLTIFSLYAAGEAHLLLRTRRPGYANWSQMQDNFAHDLAEQKRKLLLEQALDHFEQNDDVKLIGEMWELPFGDLLYVEAGMFEVPVVFMQTSNGHPWIVLSQAETETEFLDELQQQEDLLGLSPTGNPRKVIATLITEKDFDLSSIPHYRCDDVRLLYE